MSDRKHTQSDHDSLDKRISLSSAIIENTPSIIYTKDLQRKYTLVNNLFIDVFGLPEASIIQHDDYSIFDKAQADVIKAEEDEVLQSNQPMEYSHSMEIAGKSYDFIITRFPLLDASGKPYAIGGILVDVTHRKTIESERASLEEQLRISQKLESVGIMAGGIAHDFNNILQSIYLYMGIVMGNLEEDHPSYAASVNVMEAAKRARNLVDSIFTFSTEKSQDFRPVAIQHMVKESIKFLRSTLPSSLELITEIDMESGMVLGDPSLVHQMLVSLINNAEHAMRDTQGTLTIILHEREESELMGGGRVLELIVKDTGIGMDPDVKQKIFDPFFTTKEPGEASGLGLSVIFGIVRDMNGHIYVESQPDEGSSFHLVFPIVPEEEEELTLFPEDTEKVTVSRILLVDDEENIAQAGRLVIENYGASVKIAQNGEAALEIISKDPSAFDLVITDQTMPKITGLQLIKKIRKLSPVLPIILTSGTLTPLQEKNVLNDGHIEYLAKPWLPQQLIDAIVKVQGK